MTQDEVRKLILDRIPLVYVDHQTLWRMCDSPQGEDSFYFDVELVKLANAGTIRRMEDYTTYLYAGVYK